MSTALAILNVVGCLCMWGAIMCLWWWAMGGFRK